MKKIFLSFSLLMSFTAFANFHRFYRGYAHPHLDKEALLKTLNSSFFPLFPKASNHGLLSYRPALLNEDANLNLPQEIALLSFSDEETYKKYGETEIGKEIRAAHGPVFDSTKSKSVVPEVFNDLIQKEHAYLINISFDLSKLSSGILIFANPFGTNDEAFNDVASLLKKTKSPVIALVSDGFHYEYIFADNDSALEKIRKERCSQMKKTFKFNKFIKLNKQKVSDRHINYGEGIDAQW